MKMDIACPVELLHFEQADFGARRQAYLTFLNESPYVITAVSGALALMDDEGIVLEERRIAFGGMQAKSGERFTCHLALDGFPPFEAAEMVAEEVAFADDEPAWALNPVRLRDYAPPVLPEGPARNALIAIAGADAVCYPVQQEGQWVCVCGRYNRWRWPVCRRCRRERDRVLALYTPEMVEEAYEEKVAQDRRRPPRVIVDGGQARQQRRAQRVPQQAQRPPRQRVRVPVARLVTIAACVVVLGLAVWGVVTLSQRLPGNQPVQAEHTPPIVTDYLDPVQ